MLLTVMEFVERIGADEAVQIAGVGRRDDARLDEDRINGELDAATGIISGYVLPRYPTAIETPNEMLRGFCADIARWRLRGKGGQASSMAEVVKDRYDEAMRALREIAAGKLVLDIAAPGLDLAAAGAANNTFRADMPPSRRPAILGGW